jgi:hypothetical protein
MALVLGQMLNPAGSESSPAAQMVVAAQYPGRWLAMSILYFGGAAALVNLGAAGGAGAQLADQAGQGLAAGVIEMAAAPGGHLDGLGKVQALGAGAGVQVNDDDPGDGSGTQPDVAAVGQQGVQGQRGFGLPAVADRALARKRGKGPAQGVAVFQDLAPVVGVLADGVDGGVIADSHQ